MVPMDLADLRVDIEFKGDTREPHYPQRNVLYPSWQVFRPLQPTPPPSYCPRVALQEVKIKEP